MVDYRNYIVRQKLHRLVIAIYKTTGLFPKNERFNLVSQINRPAISIPTNILEGCGRETQKELIQFLYISSSSAHELVYLNYAAKELNFIENELFKKLLFDISEKKKMLYALIKKIKQQL